MKLKLSEAVSAFTELPEAIQIKKSELADSAAGVYKARRGEIDKQIKVLQAALKKMDAQQKKNPQNWGFAGNLGQIGDNIKEMVRFASSSR